MSYKLPIPPKGTHTKPFWDGAKAGRLMLPRCQDCNRVHWYPRFIKKVEIVDVERVRSINIGSTLNESRMLTQDENIVDIQFAVQYKVSNARDYVFNVRDPDTTLRQVTETAMREIVGKNNMDFVIKDGRVDVASRTKALMGEILEFYKTGLIVTNLNMQNAQPPEQVQHAFNDAIKAREDRKV